MGEKQQGWGVLAAMLAYVSWGFLPLYWKLVGDVPAAEVLAHRIVWSLVFMIVALFLMRKLKGVWGEIKQTFSSRKSGIAISLAAILISINWFIFIFAVNSDRVIEASLGYYINPLINVVLATIFLKEKLSKSEGLAFLLAVAGVVTLTVYYGYLPWAALGLALSFGFYGLIKKTAAVGAWAGLTIETLLMTPFALLFLFFIREGNSAVFHYGTNTTLFLLGAGAATAIPLLLFAAGAKRISFSLMGFLQYFAPTIMLILGVFLFQEPFSQQQFIAFVIVWTGLLIFTISRSNSTIRSRKRRETKEKAG
ncbi:chloramphenicol-sensitive protein RarD [Salibacterium salarium]|uniref:EamA family transporter RarD n=1 Tax=Salibacterium salarium TaxID=284579 RepID=UPI002788E6D7|nr:EamA family transporter RarD [Salibacterium salarium]MDQ0300034.1 chloramphenicol-sensitive protein RarD [Salibacterium salarium]